MIEDPVLPMTGRADGVHYWPGRKQPYTIWWKGLVWRFEYTHEGAEAAYRRCRITSP